MADFSTSSFTKLTELLPPSAFRLSAFRSSTVQHVNWSAGNSEQPLYQWISAYVSILILKALIRCARDSFHMAGKALNASVSTFSFADSGMSFPQRSRRDVLLTPFKIAESATLKFSVRVNHA